MIRVVAGHTFDDAELAYIGPILPGPGPTSNEYYFPIALRGGYQFLVVSSSRDHLKSAYGWLISILRRVVNVRDLSGPPA